MSPPTPTLTESMTPSALGARPLIGAFSAQVTCESSDPVHRVSETSGAGWTVIAAGAKGEAQGAVGVDQKRILGLTDEVSGVEDEGAQMVPMVHGEGLREVSTVGVAVEIDLIDAEMVRDRGEKIPP